MLAPPYDRIRRDSRILVVEVVVGQQNAVFGGDVVQHDLEIVAVVGRPDNIDAVDGGEAVVGVVVG